MGEGAGERKGTQRVWTPDRKDTFKMDEATYDQCQGQGFGLEKAADDTEERNLWNDNRVGNLESVPGRHEGKVREQGACCDCGRTRGDIHLQGVTTGEGC